MLALAQTGQALAGVSGGVEYRIGWSSADSRYHVYMRPTTAPSPDLSMTSQVTLRVPHATGANKFTVADIQPKTGTSWSLSSEVYGPTEDQAVDYLSFTMTPIDVRAFAFQAGIEQEAFSFKNTGPCTGSIELMDNDNDPFNQPPDAPNNSVGTNPGNQFANAGWGATDDNDYFGNYGGAASCTAAPTNTAPSASADTASTTQDTAVTVDVLANDSDADGDTLSIESFTQGGHGTVTATGGKLTYTPSAGFTGSDSFTYTVSDGTDTATSTVQVQVAAGSTLSASNDTYTIEANSPATSLGILANDTVPAEGTTISIATAPAHGNVEVVGNHVEYTPTADYVGQDSFTYAVSDGTDTASATVTMIMQAANSTNHAPTTVNDSATTSAGTAVEINALANDTDADGDTLSIASVTQGAHGSVATANGKLTYTPAAGFTGSDSFTYTVSDGTDTATGTVQVQVAAGSNISASNDTYTIEANSPATPLGILANDTVPAEGTTISIVTAPAHGSVEVLSNHVEYKPNADYVGQDSFTYAVSDGTDTATATVAVTVQAASTNHPPTTTINSATTATGATVDIDILGNASDPDGDTLSIASFTQGGHGVVTKVGGKLTYTPNAGFSGADSFTCTISDGKDTSTITISVTVRAASTNAPSVAVPTLTQWAQLLLTLVLGAVGLRRYSRMGK
ncbi:Ig-like domain-containing protein [Candidatus Thiothrix sp. Deng01]|uniref:Ig-like domain-containing protein n=1 Tax=Candidatus Thiothrix phosphatis TaxID=3112415 RepID=A0ABU6CVS0_9GAMM|nr:Ig-like domain-containing protein [Candidatus Thiothrix sp. Deng01]MEB4590885.1 Ig-like domain-containing protein [Candidatus Thiothrix sp. Deng01]